MIRIATPKPTPDFLFAYDGEDFDPEVGLQFNQLRHYDPTVGRFISEEPAGYASDVDLHRYASNRPQ